MAWIWVTYYIKTDKNQEMVQALLQQNLDHWKEVALDIGLDPEKNVIAQENEKQARIGISREFDEVMREEPGDWK